MRKHFLIIILITLFFSFPLITKAAFGELNYNIESVALSNEYITIKGWAFIHQTNNYSQVYKLNQDGSATDVLIKDGGGQTIFISLKNKDKNKVLEYSHITENDNYGYNFYYQHYAWDGNYGVDTYNNVNMNTCGERCYYEDLGFTIKIGISEILNEFLPGEEIEFYISATNNHLKSRGITKTVEEKLKVININGNSDYIKLVGGIPNGNVKFIAENARFQKLFEQEKYCIGDLENCNNDKAIFGKTEAIYNIMKYDVNEYKKGFFAEPSNGSPWGYEFLKNTYSPGKFAVCVNKNNGSNACSEIDDNGFCTSCEDGVRVATYGSWIKFEGTNTLTFETKNEKKCAPVTPSSGELVCNGSKTYTSTCNELTVGSANVQIIQEGNISSILTPNKIYEGGGFNFGILYTNTIKWNYADNKEPSSNVIHEAIKEEMNSKLINYNDYIAGLNISDLKLGNESKDGFLYKKCETSADPENKIDYYNKELTVSCVFHFPKSEIKQNGEVKYTTGDIGLGISNKYYTPFGYNGNYNITASITGMNRITEAAAENDSSENPIPWTGIWEDTFKNCKINVYSLLTKPSDKLPKEEINSGYYKDRKVFYNFIYRPIDITNPFPNRNAGINWYEWWALGKNRRAMKETYKNEPQYTVKLNNQTISEIKDYNNKKDKESTGYFNWDDMYWDKTNKIWRSAFIDSYVEKVGDNS